MKYLLTTLAVLAISVSAAAAQPLLSPVEINGAMSQNNIRFIDIRDPVSCGDFRRSVLDGTAEGTPRGKPLAGQRL